MTARRVVALGPLLFGVFGCGGGGESIPIADFPQRTLEALCGSEVQCGLFPDLATCEGVVFENLQFSADVSSGKIRYDGRAAAECLNGFVSLGCSVSDQNPTELQNLMQACNAAGAGTVADGGGCFNGSECVSRSCNTSACNGLTCCMGTCQAQVVNGGDCLATGATCVSGTFCKRDATAGTASCSPWIAMGRACGGSDQCVPGTICNVDPTTGNGTCGPAPGEGQACPAGRCDSDFDVCHPTSRTCVRRVAVGGACSSTAECVSYAACDAGTMTCVALAAPGAACATSSDCIGGLACNNGICQPPPDRPACP